MMKNMFYKLDPIIMEREKGPRSFARRISITKNLKNGEGKTLVILINVKIISQIMLLIRKKD